MIRTLALAALSVAIAAPAVAQMDSMSVAVELGSVLASEEACDLAFDQAAIERFIDENVRADDMRFASTLNMMTQGSSMQISDMSASAKTAHCAQIRRVARANGFIDE